VKEWAVFIPNGFPSLPSIICGCVTLNADLKQVSWKLDVATDGVVHVCRLYLVVFLYSFRLF
jgi:hypothetical protein